MGPIPQDVAPARFSTAGDLFSGLDLIRLIATVQTAVGAQFAGKPVALMVPSLDAGEKTTLIVALCPAARVKDEARPLRLNPFPVIVPPETVKADFPELPNFRVWVELVPARTLPKLMLEGLTVSCPLASSAYRRMFNRRKPVALHGQ